MDFYKKRGKYLVSIVKPNQNLKKSVEKAVNLIGGFKKIIKKGETILIKPNYNSDDSPPASSDPMFVRAVIELLYDNGAKKVIIGESSGPYWKPTNRVLKRMGLLSVAKKLKVKVHSFDKEKWVKVDVKGKYLDKVHVAKTVLDCDKIVYLPCLKTHNMGRFTLSMKLTMGLIKNMDRYRMHTRKLEEKVADINLAVKPALIIIDGRKCFVTKGPSCGEVKEPNVILASGDRVAIDVEGVKILKKYKADNKLGMPIWKLPQIKAAVELGLGSQSEKDYEVLK